MPKRKASDGGHADNGQLASANTTATMFLGGTQKSWMTLPNQQPAASHMLPSRPVHALPRRTSAPKVAVNAPRPAHPSSPLPSAPQTVSQPHAAAMSQARPHHVLPSPAPSDEGNLDGATSKSPVFNTIPFNQLSPDSAAVSPHSRVDMDASFSTLTAPEALSAAPTVSALTGAATLNPHAQSAASFNSNQQATATLDQADSSRVRPSPLRTYETIAPAPSAGLSASIQSPTVTSHRRLPVQNQAAASVPHSSGQSLHAHGHQLPVAPAIAQAPPINTGGPSQSSSGLGAPSTTAPGHGSPYSSDSMFAQQSLDMLNSTTSQWSLNSIERKRLTILVDALHNNDFLYLLWHQIYCLGTSSPDLPASLRNNENLAAAYKCFEHLVQPNTVVTPHVLEFFCGWPAPPRAWDKTPSCVSVFNQHLQQIATMARSLAEGLAKFADICYTRQYPPSPGELVNGLGVLSVTLQGLLWGKLATSIWPSNQALLAQANQAFHRAQVYALTHPRPQSEDELQQEFTAYRVDIMSILANHSATPQLLPSQLFHSNVPRALQPSQAAHQAQAQAIPSASLVQQPSPNSVQPPQVASRDPQYQHQHQHQQYQQIHTAQQAQQQYAPQQPNQSPQQARTYPALVQNVYSSHPPQLQYVQYIQRHPSQEQSASIPSAPTPGYYQPTQHSGQVVIRPNQQPPNGPLNSPREHGRPFPWQAQQSPRVHQAYLPAQQSPASLVTVPLSPAQRVPSNVPAPVQSRPHPNQHRFIPIASAPQSNRRIPPLFIPPASAPPPSVPAVATPERSALHQVHLASPPLKAADSRADWKTNPLYQHFVGFSVAPTTLSRDRPVTSLKFNVTEEDFARIARRKNQTGKDDTAGKFRAVNASSRTYRLRCVRVPPESNIEDESVWAITPTSWVPFGYYSLNDVYLEERRKLTHGKDLPIDITDALVQGENLLQVFLVRYENDKVPTDFAIAIETIGMIDHYTIRDECVQDHFIPYNECLDKIKATLAPSDHDDDLAIVSSSLTLNVFDPFSGSLISSMPVRGRSCRHFDCFDLENFLATRKKTVGDGPSVYDHWLCPICKADSRPQCLVVDGFLATILSRLRTNYKDTCQDIKAIIVNDDGSCVVKEEPAEDRSRSRSAPTENKPSVDQHARQHQVIDLDSD